MRFNKKLVLFLGLFLIVLNAYSQASVTVNENGAYFIDCGTVKKIPSDVDLTYSRFWKNYIVFLSGAYSSGMLVYNTNNGATSDFFETGSRKTGIYGQYVYVDKGRNLFFNLNGFEYELDPVTLKTINRATVIDETLDYDWNQYDQDIHGSTFIKERTIRYRGEKYYVDVTFGNKVDVSNKGNWYIQGGKYDERFVLVVTDYTNPPR
jgi:hypothetical protein